MLKGCANFEAKSAREVCFCGKKFWRNWNASFINHLKRIRQTEARMKIRNLMAFPLTELLLFATGAGEGEKQSNTQRESREMSSLF